MAVREPNLTLTLKHVAGCGAVLSTEQQVALDYSLNIKKAEAGVRSLSFWGKITTRNSKDYLVAEGTNHAQIVDNSVRLEAKYYFSQDGVKWIDLPAVDAGVVKFAATLRSQLSGDCSKVYPEGSGEEEQQQEGEDAQKQETMVITELQRLRAMIDSINADTGVLPVGCAVVDAQNNIVANPLFPGLEFPDKLESYRHRSLLPDQRQSTLAHDVRGSWSLLNDPFKGVTLLRSLTWPGYFFYYDNNALSWGALYMGAGLKNTDLVFML